MLTTLFRLVMESHQSVFFLNPNDPIRLTAELIEASTTRASQDRGLGAKA